MSLAFARTVGWRYLRSRRGFVSVVTGFSLVGIALGVAALIVVMAVMAGFRVELLDRILGTTGHAQISRTGMTLEESEGLRLKLLDLPGVVSAEPVVGGQAMLVSPAKATGALARGVRKEALTQNPLISTGIRRGSLAHFGEPGTIVIGQALADSLGVSVGDHINLLSPQGSSTVVGFIPRMMQVEVVATFDVGMYQYDSGLVFLPIVQAQTFFKTGGLVNGLELMVKEPDRILNMMPTLAAIVGPGGHISPWMENNRQFFSALQVEKTTMFIILTLIVLVAAFNIITGQMMMVNEKRRDIAILRTMGARRADILRVFFYSGFMAGTVGTVGGLLLGLVVTDNLQHIVHSIQNLFGINVFSAEVYFLSELPAVIVPEDVATIVVMSLALAMAASLYPAWRATRLDPVEALRHE